MSGVFLLRVIKKPRSSLEKSSSGVLRGYQRELIDGRAGEPVVRSLGTFELFVSRSLAAVSSSMPAWAIRSSSFFGLMGFMVLVPLGRLQELLNYISIFTIVQTCGA